LCEQETIRIYDERGEKIAQVCGVNDLPGDTDYTMTISRFIPNSSGGGGNITINLNGRFVAAWNCLDRNGNMVPNSYYHFVLEGHTQDGATIRLETTAFVAPHRGEGISLNARPNIARDGDVILFYASLGGIPPDERSHVRIYTLAGELVQSIPITNGTASWILNAVDGRPVASGIYIAVLDGINPANGQKSSAKCKVLVLH
jgi:hypothetical protein